jgi:hypothetical protein
LPSFSPSPRSLFGYREVSSRRNTNGATLPLPSLARAVSPEHWRKYFLTVRRDLGSSIFRTKFHEISWRSLSTKLHHHGVSVDPLLVLVPHRLGPVRGWKCYFYRLGDGLLRGPRRLVSTLVAYVSPVPTFSRRLGVATIVLGQIHRHVTATNGRQEDCHGIYHSM